MFWFSVSPREGEKKKNGRPSTRERKKRKQREEADFVRKAIEDAVMVLESAVLLEPNHCQGEEGDR